MMENLAIGKLVRDISSIDDKENRIYLLMLNSEGEQVKCWIEDYENTFVNLFASGKVEENSVLQNVPVGEKIEKGSFLCQLQGQSEIYLVSFRKKRKIPQHAWNHWPFNHDKLQRLSSAYKLLLDYVPTGADVDKPE